MGEVAKYFSRDPFDSVALNRLTHVLFGNNQPKPVIRLFIAPSENQQVSM